MSPLILVVDDDSELRNIYRHALERASYSTIEASNGIEALKAIEAYSPALVIMDIAMPQMNGSELLEKMRQNPETAGIPIVIVTARPEYEALAVELGAEAFLLKPVGPNQVLDVLNELLR